MEPWMHKALVRVGQALGVGAAASLTYLTGAASATAGSPELIAEVRLLKLHVQDVGEAQDRIELRQKRLQDYVSDRLDALTAEIRGAAKR